MDWSGFFSTSIVTVAIILLAALLILWFILPFAVFGIKDKLNNIIQLLEESNKIKKGE